VKEPLPFGEWLRKQRRALDLSRQDLANQAGCAEITLRRIEAGTLKPSKELAFLLLDKIGIPDGERLQWVAFARGTASLPTNQTLSSPSEPKTNLPAFITTFIGREKEQVEIRKLIHKHRLVTLTGSGGVGKTRLSIKTGGHVLEDYVNGVWLVELASLNDPALLPQTVAKVFGLVTQSEVPILEILINFLRPKTTLLIFDNCEHLLDACAQLTDTLLKNCPNVKIFATSREPMGIMGEALYHVPSLELPDIQQLLDHFKEYESVRLFVERAQLTQTDFSLTMENASFVSQICSRLDGIPLALELAAAKFGSLSVAEIDRQLETSFNLLTGGSRTALPRQQTLRASIDWSWNLLTEPEQSFMRQLSIFAGGWTLESAQALCDREVVGLTSSLVKKSLIVMNQALPSEQTSGRHEFDRKERRYHFHEMIRQYAREKLIETGEEENIRTLHLKYFLGFSEEADRAGRGHEQLKWNARFNDESDNLRAALDWALKTNIEAGLYLSGRLWFFWEGFNISEGARWLKEFTKTDKANLYPRAKAKALVTHARLLELLQQPDQARVAAEESLELARAYNDPQDEIDGLLALVDIANSGLPIHSRAELAQMAYTLSQSINDPWRQALALGIWGWDRRDPEQARARWEQSTILFREVGDLSYLVTYLCYLGQFEITMGYLDTAKKRLDEAVLLSQRTSRKRNALTVFHASGQLAVIMRDYDLARINLQKAIMLGEEIGERMESPWCRIRLGDLAILEGKLSEARQLFIESAKTFQRDGEVIGIAFALERLANIYIMTAKFELAARWIGWADATREKLNNPRPRLEQTDVDKIIATCRAKMGKAAFSKAYNAGKQMSLDEAVEFALGDN